MAIFNSYASLPEGNWISSTYVIHNLNSHLIYWEAMTHIFGSLNFTHESHWGDILYMLNQISNHWIQFDQCLDPTSYDMRSLSSNRGRQLDDLAAVCLAPGGFSTCMVHLAGALGDAGRVGSHDKPCLRKSGATSLGFGVFAVYS